MKMQDKWEEQRFVSPISVLEKSLIEKWEANKLNERRKKSVGRVKCRAKSSATSDSGKIKRKRYKVDQQKRKTKRRLTCKDLAAAN